MNPGPVEEAGSTARTLIASLTTTPMILALVCFNLFYIAMTSWFQREQGIQFTENQAIWEKLTEKAMNVCAQAASK